MIKTILKTTLLCAIAASLGCTEDSTITESTSLVPDDPSALTVGTTTGTAITISWTDNATNETAYAVERCSGASCSSYSAVSASPLAANSTTHTETGLSTSTVYRFRVKATNSFGSSSYITSSDITTASTSSASANMCTAPTTTVLDYGTRATSTTTLAIRGAYSSMALKTGTSYPGVVFTEAHTAGATALKFMYWDGSRFKYETISAGNTFAYVKLVYLQSGIPLVFWGNNLTALYGAARSTASTSTEGTWTVAALDTSSTAIRGVDASVNPDDEVAVFFVGATGAASQHKAILCQSNCATMNTTQYPAMSIADATNSATNTYKVGVAWCNSGAQYYPMFFYPAAATFRLATCRQSDLSLCSGNWTSGTIGAASANRVAADMYIDATATDSTVYMAGLEAAGITPWVMTGCATTAAAGAWASQTTGTTMGAATTGNAWLDLERDSSNNFHIAANDAVTIIRTFSATTAGYTSGAWSAAPTTNYAETTGAAGLQAGGAGRGSLVVDNTNDQLLISYGRTAALSPVHTWGNLVIAYNECPSGVGAPACASTTLGSVAASTGMWWGNMAADTSGQIQKTSLAWPNVSTAVNDSGTPAVAYVDYSVSGTTDPVIGARLKFAYRNGSTASSQWLISTIGGLQSSPQSPSLAFDSNGYPWVAWTETPAATVSQRFFLATNSRTDGQGAWTIYPFPSFYPVSAPTAQPAMAQAVVAMYESGGVRKPLVTTMSSIATVAGREIRSALFDPTTRLWSNVKQVAIFAGAATIGGAYLSTDWNSSGTVVVAFNDLSTGAGQVYCTGTARCIRMYYTTDGGATWTGTTTSGVINGAYDASKIRLNPSTGRPAIAYFDRANNQLRYKYCTTALASCTSSGNWADLGVGIMDATLGISGLAEATNLGQLDSGFTFTSDGLPWVVYPRGSTSTTNPNLMYTYVATSGGLFGATAALYTNPGVGNTSTPVAATANNYALSWNPSSVRSSYTGSLHTAFVGPGNFLYMTSCGN